MMTRNRYLLLPAALMACYLALCPMHAAESANASAATPEKARPANAERKTQGVLDDTQRDLLREAMREHLPELRKLDEQLRTASRELMRAALAPQLDEQAVREKAEALAKIQVEQAVLRSKVFTVVVPTLQPDQRTQIENNPYALQTLLGSAGTSKGALTEGERDRIRRMEKRADRPVKERLKAP